MHQPTNIDRAAAGEGLAGSPAPKPVIDGVGPGAGVADSPAPKPVIDGVGPGAGVAGSPAPKPVIDGVGPGAGAAGDAPGTGRYLAPKRVDRLFNTLVRRLVRLGISVWGARELRV